jgi:hypothetical protein
MRSRDLYKPFERVSEKRSATETMAKSLGGWSCPDNKYVARGGATAELAINENA